MCKVPTFFFFWFGVCWNYKYIIEYIYIYISISIYYRTTSNIVQRVLDLNPEGSSTGPILGMLSNGC
jgi:hypothetical protein